MNAAGRASGVTYLRDGETYFQPADIVLMGCFTFENVRLLLLSKSKLFPNGLSNNHGQVGRHYMTHNEIGSVSALFPENLNNWYGLPAQGIAIDNWADDNFDHAGLDFIGGVNLWAMNARRPIAAASAEHSAKPNSGVRTGKPSFDARMPTASIMAICKRPRFLMRSIISISIRS